MPDQRLAFVAHTRLEGLEYGGAAFVRPMRPKVTRHYRWREPQVLADLRSEVEAGKTLDEARREYEAKRAYCKGRGYLYVVVNDEGEIEEAIRRQLRWALEDRRLIAEQERAVLGPAHLRWRDHSAAENRSRWSGWDWSTRGEEWTASIEWKHALIEDVLKRWIPAGVTVLEIGPGAGRWTEVLASRAADLILVDVSEPPLDLCRQRFADASNIGYVLSSGTDLPTIADRAVDAIWSFDVFVHIAPRDQAAYLTEIARVLAPGGVAVIHHADGRNRGEWPSRQGWRAPMSRKLFAALATQRKLEVERQLDSWGAHDRYHLSRFGDAITVLRQPKSPQRVSNDGARGAR